MKPINIEVEGSEILIQSKEGHYAVIPAKHRQKVMDMVKDNCDGCINSYIQGLPKEADYAQNGTIYPVDDKGKPTTKETYTQWGDRIKKLAPNLDYTIKGDYNSRGAYEGGLEPEWVNHDEEFKTNRPSYAVEKEGKWGAYHLGSRNPKTGEVLKSKNHPTFNIAMEEDFKAGYETYEANDGKIYSNKRTDYDPKNVKSYLNTYDGGTLPEITITAEMPQWAKDKRQFEKDNPKSDYINKYLTPFARSLGNTETNYPKRLDYEYEQKALDYASKQLIKNNPQGKLSRVEWLNQMSDKEEELARRNPKYQSSLWEDTKRGLTSLVEQNPLQTFQNILNSSDYSTREKQEMLKDYADHPIMSKLGDAAKILSPLSVGSKVVQSTYRDDTTLNDALKGKKNKAGMIEDMVTDPTTYIGAGIAKSVLKGGLKNATKITGKTLATKADDIAKPIASSVDDVGNLANQFRKNPLSDKELKMYKWLEQQQKFDKLPKTTNKESLGVLDDFKTRIQTPEGKRRMKELGIDSDEMLQKIDIVEDPNTFGYYKGDKNKIVKNPLDPLPSGTIRHEIEHGVQNAMRKQAIKDDGKIIPSIKRMFTDPLLKKPLPDKITKFNTEIDDLLSGLELRREGTPNKVWKGHVDHDTPVNINDFKPELMDKQNATDYFLTGSEGREKSAFLGEVQQYMMDAGTIPKKGYVEITPEMVKNTMVDAMFDEANGGKFLRLFNIMKASDANYNLVAKGLNKMLGIVPAALGAGAASQNNKTKTEE